MHSQSPSLRRQGALVPPPLEKYTNSTDDNSDVKAVIIPQADLEIPFHPSYISTCTMNSQINELQVHIFLLYIDDSLLLKFEGHTLMLYYY